MIHTFVTPLRCKRCRNARKTNVQRTNGCDPPFSVKVLRNLMNLAWVGWLSYFSLVLGWRRWPKDAQGIFLNVFAGCRASERASKKVRLLKTVEPLQLIWRIHMLGKIFWEDLRLALNVPIVPSLLLRLKQIKHLFCSKTCNSATRRCQRHDDFVWL